MYNDDYKGFRTTNKQQLRYDSKELIKITIDNVPYYCAPHHILGYFISTCGEVISCKHGRVANKNGVVTFDKPKLLKQSCTGTKYKYVMLYHEGKRFKKAVHKLAVEAHLIAPDTPYPLEVNHVNQDRFDNKIANLELISGSENRAHYRWLRQLKEQHNERYQAIV